MKKQEGKTPYTSQSEVYRSLSEKLHCTPPGRGRKNGGEIIEPVGNPITKSLLVKPLISPVIYFISFLTSFITFEVDIITVKLFMNSHKYNPLLSAFKRKSKTRERSVARNRYREQP